VRGLDTVTPINQMVLSSVQGLCKGLIYGGTCTGIIRSRTYANDM